LKRIFIIIIILTIFLTAFVSYKQYSWNAFTPELFGNGVMNVNIQNGKINGHISAWGEWEIYGTTKHCFIKQVAGEPIGGAEKPIACHMNMISKNQFNGWIDFRGHERKFCGGKTLPHKCLGK
jgi:hypothetical protein